MAKRRSIRDGRPTIRDADEAQRADYGAGDLYEIVGLTRGQLQSWLAERGIFTIGRFGEWAYINSDESLHRGLALGKRLRDS